jgi:vacuolar-type H+-ATPase subunit I/STV1
MTMGTGVLLVAIGAILRYAVNDSIDSIDLETVGLILMVAGAVAFIVGAIYAFGRRGRVVTEQVVERPVAERPVVERERY